MRASVARQGHVALVAVLVDDRLCLHQDFDGPLGLAGVAVDDGEL
jgi:hypothetical protein